MAASRLVAPSRVVGLEPTCHLPQVGEAMRLRGEVVSTHATASVAEGGDAQRSSSETRARLAGANTAKANSAN